MADREEIACTVDKPGTNYKQFKLNEGIKSKPPFGLFRDGETESMERVFEYLLSRILSPDRVDLKEQLQDMDMERFDGWDVVLNTRGSTNNDPYWLKVKDSDTFEECSIRYLGN